MARPDKQTLLKFLDDTTPIIARILCKVEGRILTLPEIVSGSRLPMRTVQRIYSASSWDGIKAGTASKFLTGCRVDILNTEELNRMKRELIADMESGMLSAPPEQRPYFIAMIGKIK
jgi:hypothetical protein